MEFSEAWVNSCSSVGIASRMGDIKTLRTLLNDGKTVDVQDNRGWRPVHEATGSNNASCLKLILKRKGNDINWTTFEGETALFLASKAGFENIISILLKYGADPNVTNNESQSPLLMATKTNNRTCVELLVQAGACVNQQDFVGWSPLHAAVNCKNLKLVSFLVESGAKIDIQDDCQITPVFHAAQSGCKNSLLYLIEKAKEIGLPSIVNIPAEDSATPLMMTAQYGFKDGLELLLQNGADPNAKTTDNVMALHLAVQNGDLECVKILLEITDKNMLLSCSLDPINKSPEWQTLSSPLKPRNEEHSISPLHLAVIHKRHEILQYLLDNGLNPNDFLQDINSYCPCEDIFLKLHLDHCCGAVKPRFITALGVAVFMNSAEDVISLIKAGCLVDPPTLDIISPLSIAAFEEYLDILELLLQNGADPNYPSKIYPSVCPLPLLAATNDSKSLFALLKAGGDARKCLPLSGRPCLAFVVSYFIQPHRSAFYKIGNVMSVYHQFLAERLPKSLIHEVYDKWLNIYTASPAKHNWKTFLDTLEQPFKLMELCRLKIRECIMDNGRNEVPFLIQLKSLPVADCISRYLAFD